ncbi:glutathione gamma-glutamylcysteinyltransferase [Elysia marginata]|uniref:glutathione gamma-glutamylcysteinyltransferase n=1 Tax=Elysia marginata TaxID=1093978 RepID=A0AAV4GZV0_9GAST|nr:glutathione gamma-glutamylcysteinyltransferase [Elysia marginata]
MLTLKETHKPNTGVSAKQFYRRPLPESCIDFTSSKGKEIFSEALASGHMECFFKLMAQYRTQDEIAYCGITSLVMALNALEVDPGRVWKGPWRWYHESMLDCCTPLEVAQEKGINMVQFVCLAKCNGLHPYAVPGHNIPSLEQLRGEIKRITKREDVVFIASYGRKVLGQTGDGHFSPIAGYHEGLDLVLILDTARFKYPPHWIKLQTFLDAMKTIDKDTGKSRGYVLLSIAKDQFSPLLFRPSCELSVYLERGSQSPELQKSYIEWKNWLNRDDVALNNENVISHCTQHLLTMIAEGYFKKGALCLAMPFSLCFAPEKKIESLVIECEKLHISARKMIYALKSLFVEMESTKTFKLVKEFLTKSQSKNELFFQMVQCRSEPHLGSPSSDCQAECCVQSSGSRDVGAASLSETPESLEEKPCCGGHGSDNCVTTDSAKTSLDCETDCDTKCRFKFDCRPEHIATVFLFVWPHEDLSQKNVKSCSSCRETSEALKQSDSSFSNGETKDFSDQRTTLAATLRDFLHIDLEQAPWRWLLDDSPLKQKIISTTHVADKLMTAGAYHNSRGQRGRVVSASDSRSGGREFDS